MTISDEKRARLLAYLNDPDHEKRARPFLVMIQLMGNEPLVRACLALARQALAEYEAHPHERIPPALVDEPRRMVFKTEKRLDNLEAPLDRESELMIITGPEEPELLADQDGLLAHARWFSICLHALTISGPGTKRFEDLEGLIQDISCVWRTGQLDGPSTPDHERIIGFVITELLPWASGQGDPLKDKPTVYPRI